jgi:glycosyltransferase involved in cell wall biosynthesis
MNIKPRKRVLFVGAFNSKTKDGSSGGQLFACTSLINSKLRSYVEFVLIDTTSETVPAPPLYKRFTKVFRRFFSFFYFLLFTKIDTVLLFSSAKASFIEKGTMALIAKLFRKKVLFAPRSGLLLRDYQCSTFMRFLMRTVVRKADYVICQGVMWQVFYQKISGVSVNRLPVINNWIDYQKYGWEIGSSNNKKITVIYVGWLEEYKGVMDLLTALISLKNSVDFECRIYGNGSLYNKAEQFIEENQLSTFVSLMGWVNAETKKKVLSEANIYILPSHTEGFPNALLEAMASGLAVVAADVGAVSDLVTNGVNGLLYETRNTKQLSQAIYKLLTESSVRENLGKKARTTVAANFTVDTAVEKFLEIV